MTAAAPTRTRCKTCEKEKVTAKCSGCSEDFCYPHLGEHRLELSRQLDEIEVQRDLLRETMNQQTTDWQKHGLIQQVDQWESESIQKIKQTANETRQLLLTYIRGQTTRIEENFNQLTNRLR